MVIENPDENAEFFAGQFAAGFLAGGSGGWPGWGFYFAVDVRPPEPGLLVVLGPVSLWARRHWGAHLWFLRYRLLGTGTG